MMTTKRTFLVVGGSSGIGLNVALVALEEGHGVIATARNSEHASSAHPELESLGGKWLTLDVSDDETEYTISRTVEEHRVDVVVNAAGYAILGPMEDISPSELHKQLDVNLVGALRVMRGVLPFFRQCKGGTIVNVSSGAALIGRPSRGAYAASKAALEAISESLSAELRPFNIKVLIVDLGAFSTNFTKALVFPAKSMTDEYHGTVTEQVMDMTKKMSTTRLGDAHEAARRIVEVVTGTGMAQSERVQNGARLILGSDCLKTAREKYKSLSEDCDAMEHIARSTDPKID